MGPGTHRDPYVPPAPLMHLCMSTQVSAPLPHIPAHTHMHAYVDTQGTALHELREAGVHSCVPAHLASTHAPTVGGIPARPGPEVAVFKTEKCRQLGMLCQRT